MGLKCISQMLSWFSMPECRSDGCAGALWATDSYETPNFSLASAHLLP